jgi:hypothetical protein
VSPLIRCSSHSPPCTTILPAIPIDRPNTTKTGKGASPYPHRRIPRHRPLDPKLHCAKAIHYFEWRPDHPGFPPIARTIGPLSEASKRLNSLIITPRAPFRQALRLNHS